MLNFRTSDKILLEKINNNTVPVLINYHNEGDFQIRYVEVGYDTLPAVIFIHGTPGSLDAFLNFLRDKDLQKKIRMVSVDRPGWGYSNFGKAVTDLDKQAAMLKFLLDEYGHKKPPVLVGHSYGGTLAVKLAMKYPGKVGGLLLIGAAVDPGHEKHFKISGILHIPLIKNFVPTAWKEAGIEKDTHIAELEKMRTDWVKVTAPVIILHGKKDDLVPVENAFYCDSMLIHANKKLVIKDKLGHLIPFTRPQIVKAELYRILDMQN